MSDAPAPSGMPTKPCARCNTEKPLTAFAGRQNTCIQCREAAKARTLERKDGATFTPELGEKITDALASGLTVAEITAQAAMPTPRQLRAWRRSNPDFEAACLQAEQASAAAHIDAAKQVVRQMEEGKIPAAEGNHIFNAHMKLAAVLAPARYGAHPVAIDITSQGRPLVDFEKAIEALINALPAKALPAPAIDIEASPAPTETLQ
jgi:terminase small subunit-like protein